MGRWIEYLNVMKQQWRWWTLLGATLLAVCALLPLQLEVQREERVPLFTAGNDFLLFTEYRWGRSFVSQWRWKERHWDRIPSAQVSVSGDRQTLFLVNDDLTVVDRHSLETKDTIPLGNMSKRPPGWLIAMSDNHRFAVFFRHGDHLSTETFRYVHRLQVVDLVTKKVVQDRLTLNHLQRIDGRNDFDIYPAEAKGILFEDQLPAGHWRVTEYGTIEHIDPMLPPVPSQPFVLVERQLDGSWRVLRKDESHTTVPAAVGAHAVAVSPDGKWLIVDDATDSRFYRINEESREIALIETPSRIAHFGWSATEDHSMSANFSEDGKSLYLFGRLGYIAVVDTATWKVVAEDYWGHYLIAKQWSLVLAAAFLAGIWCIAAARTASILWITMAIGFLGFFGQWAVYLYWSVGNDSFYRWTYVFEANVVSALFVGIAVGTMSALGWLWAWGKGWQHDRWAAGVIALGLNVFPICLYGLQWLPERVLAAFSADDGLVGSYELACAAIQLMGAMTAALTAVASVPRWFGWKFANASESGSHHFQLGEVFVVVAGVGIAVALGNAALASASDELQRRALAIAILTLFVTLLASVLATFRWSWIVFLSLLLVAAATVLIPGKAFVTDMLWPTFFSDLKHNVIQLVFLFTALAFASFPMVCLRRQGWRWTRVTATADEAPLVPAANAAA